MTFENCVYIAKSDYGCEFRIIFTSDNNIDESDPEIAFTYGRMTRHECYDEEENRYIYCYYPEERLDKGFLACPQENGSYDWHVVLLEKENSTLVDLNKKERLLNEREIKLNEREKLLNERETILNEKEKQLNAKKPIVVSYTSSFYNENDYKLIGTFTDEQVAINFVIPWLIKNQLGGFDFHCLADLFSDNIDDNDGERPSELDFEPTEENFIKYYNNKCKTWDDLVQILDNDGNSYFRDSPGWDIHWN
jgi:hypothetical protein